jgi:hypothetical protein
MRILQPFQFGYAISLLLAGRIIGQTWNKEGLYMGDHYLEYWCNAPCISNSIGEAFNTILGFLE